jgi:hypothetical protein
MAKHAKIDKSQKEFIKSMKKKFSGDKPDDRSAEPSQPYPTDDHITLITFHPKYDKRTPEDDRW